MELQSVQPTVLRTTQSAMFYNTFTLMPYCFFNKLLTSHLALVTHENMVKFTALEDPWTSGCIL